MNLMPLADLLESSGHGNQGDTVFLNMMPAQAETAILLRSPLTGTPIDYELPGYYRTEFQLIVRGRDYVAAEVRIAAVVATLTLKNAAVGPLYFNYCRPKTEPVSFPLSDGNLFEFSTNFDVSFVRA
jgi:hypothetical protein